MTTTIRHQKHASLRRGKLPVLCAAVTIAILVLANPANAIRKPSHSTNAIQGKPPQRKHKRLPRNDAESGSSSCIESADAREHPESLDDARALPRGGAKKPPLPAPPSIYWAVLHNWLYFLSLGFNAVNIPYMIREIVDGDAKASPSPRSIALSGNVEAVDKLLTFGGVAFLAALSDKHGRKGLMAWSSFGFCGTNLLQAFAGKAPTPGASRLLLYLADLVDGCSSCMTPVCQAYVADCTSRALQGGGGGASLASNLGIFQGISVGGAFVLAFPIGGLLGAKHGPRLPILMAAGFQLVNGLLAFFVTPESNARALERKLHTSGKAQDDAPIRLSEVNPVTGLKNLLGIGTKSGFGTTSQGLLRTASLTYLFLSLARASMDAQFVNYSNIRFGWTQAQSGPVLVMTGLMLAIVPRILVPRLGVARSVNWGLLVVGSGLASAGLVASSPAFVASIAVIAVGFVSIPALQALLANLAPPGESGALLGAIGSMNELTGAIGSSLYATILSIFATESSPIAESLPPVLKIPGMHFLVGASLCLVGWIVSSTGLKRHGGHPALAAGIADKSVLTGDVTS